MPRLLLWVLPVISVLAGCSDAPVDYKEKPISTPGGNYTVTVGTPSTRPWLNADGTPYRPRPYHYVTKEIVTPGGTMSVQVREYDRPAPVAPATSTPADSGTPAQN